MATNETANVDGMRMTSDVAKRLGVTRQTARNYAEAGHFPNARKLPSGLWQIPDSDIDAFLQKCRDRARFPSMPRQTTEATNVVTT